MMNAFPAPAEQQATLANWRTPPFNRWAFQHVREVVPTAEIAGHPAWRWEFPRALRDVLDLGFTVAGVASGFLVSAMGYAAYFVFTFIATIPSMVLVFFVPNLDEPPASGRDVRPDGQGGSEPEQQA